MKKKYIETFYDIQSKQWKKSLFLFFIILAIYFISITSMVFVIGCFLYLYSVFPSKGNIFLKLILIGFFLSLIIALIHFFVAKYAGANIILNRLNAQKPDENDSYHKEFMNILDELKIATGINNIEGYIIPSSAVNSMGVMKSDGTPIILMTEGMLEKCSRAEIAAAIAHEIAHIIKGDTYFITLVCSLTNFFNSIVQKMQESEEQKYYGYRYGRKKDSGAAIILLIYLISLITYIFMKLLSATISRQREILADAMAVEITRDPISLAKAIYKANFFYSLVCSEDDNFSPLFLVSPESRGIEVKKNFFKKIISTHPPAMQRINILVNMAHVSVQDLVKEIWEELGNKHLKTILSSEELKNKENKDKSVWKVKVDNEKWIGPFTIAELLSQPFLSEKTILENIENNKKGYLKDFDELRDKLKGINLCPYCKVKLKDIQYEGVKIKYCPKCYGKVVKRKDVFKILTRKKYSFSKKLKEKAQKLKKDMLLNPFKVNKRIKKNSKITCPQCGGNMLLRPFNYEYFIPIDECLSCGIIWFDPDELEILQILKEEHERG